MSRLNTETMQLLAQVNDPGLKVALSALFHQQASQHEQNQEKLVGLETMINDGFPDGDREAHKNYHRLVMEQIATRNQFMKDCITALGKYGLIGLCGWLVWKLFGVKWP